MAGGGDCWVLRPSRGMESGPTAELKDSSCMASIMISSFNSISVKTFFD